MDNSHIADTFQIILLASLFVIGFLLCRQCRLLKRVLRKSARQNNIDTDDDGQYRYATPAGLWTCKQLLRSPGLYEGRNVFALLHLSNLSLLMNLLGTEYAENYLCHVLQQLHHILPAGTLFSRERFDKLAIVFPGNLSVDEVRIQKEVLQGLFHALPSHNDGYHHTQMLTGNTGVVHETITRETISDIFLRAGIALHRAREAGNAVVVVFEQKMQDEGLHRLSLHEKLSRAIRNNEFYLVLQPIISLTTPGIVIRENALSGGMPVMTAISPPGNLSRWLKRPVSSFPSVSGLLRLHAGSWLHLSPGGHRRRSGSMSIFLQRSFINLISKRIYVIV